MRHGAAGPPGDGGHDVAAISIVVAITGVAAAGAAQSDHAAPLIAFVGAIAVTVLAAVTANRRQLQALAAERDRLDRQLEHDRRLQELEHLRDFLDAAAAAYESLEEATVKWAVELAASTSEQAASARQAAWGASKEFASLGRRMSLRFAPEHTVGRTFESLRRILEVRYDHLSTVDPAQFDANSLRPGSARPISQEQDAEDDRLDAAARVALDEFAQAARLELGRAAADIGPRLLSGLTHAF